MIYVLTVHWRFDFWVDVQIAHLRRYLRDPFKIYAFCDGTRNDHSAKFDYCSPLKGIVDHASKLNALAAVVCESADEDDALVFCDSDAFPSATSRSTSVPALRNGRWSRCSGSRTLATCSLTRASR